MKPPRSWQLVLATAIAALLSLTLLPAVSTPSPARADVESLAITDSIVTSGATTTLVATFTESEHNASFTIEGLDSASTASLHVDRCSPSCQRSGVTNDDTDHPSVTTNDLVQVDLTLSVKCEVEDVFTVRVEQTLPTDFKNVAVTCRPPPGNITIAKSAAGASASVEFSFSVTTAGPTAYECTNATFKLTNGASKNMVCDTSVTYTITETEATGWKLTAIDCPITGAPVVSKDLNNNRVTVTVFAGDVVACTFVNIKPPGPAATLTVASDKGSLGCSGGATLTINVKDAAGAAVADGTAVAVQASIGTIAGSPATTAGGVARVTYSAPDNAGGTATVTAVTGAASGTASISVDCAGAAAPPPVATSQSQVQIQPPNTGDGGLAR